MKSMINRMGGLILLFTASTLLAQPASPPPSVPTQTSAEMTTALQGFTKEITDAYRLVQQLQLQARKDKDVIRLNCINDKLIQMKAMRNIFDEAKSRFETADSGTEQTIRFDETRESWNKIRTLREQAQLCVGEVQFQSESKGGWDAPDIPDDPSKNPFPETPEDPGYASPFN
jgi:hypothetical protein